MALGRWFWILGLAWLGGCSFPVREEVDRLLCCKAELSLDPEPLPQDGKMPEPFPDLFEKKLEKVEGKTLNERLQVPPGLPGGKVEDIKLPPATAPREEIEKAIDRYFPGLPPLPNPPQTESGPEGKPLTLENLQKMALANNPMVRQAVAGVEAARGQFVQSGLYPNPIGGFSTESNGPGGGPMTGGFVGQTFKTPGKLMLARRAAGANVEIAELQLRQVENDVRTQVRSQYFEVLVARENLRVNLTMARLTDEIFKVMVLQLKGGEVAAYEPMQVRVLALQARALTVQAYNRYLSAWKQLAASVGVPGMPLTELAGRVDLAIPRYHYDQVLAYILQNHTEVQAAFKLVEKAEAVLSLARLTPVPDVDTQVSIIRDMSPPGPAKAVALVQVGLPIPLWDRNQGNIRTAQANLVRVQEEGQRVRNDLVSRLALAFERYENNRVLVQLYTTQILPNQVQAFRAAVARHARGGEKAGVSYNDLVTAEQTLVNQITNYLGTLREQWSAIVAVGNLLQTSDLFGLAEEEKVSPVPDLEQLIPLGHGLSCDPVNQPEWRRPEGFWPSAVPWDQKSFDSFPKEMKSSVIPEEHRPQPQEGISTLEQEPVFPVLQPIPGFEILLENPMAGPSSEMDNPLPEVPPNRAARILPPTNFEIITLPSTNPAPSRE